MRLVFDTAILARANPKASGIARELLERVWEDGHSLIVSPFLLEEIKRVLSYARLQAQYKLSAVEITDFVDYLETVAEVIDPVVTEPVVLSDPNDDPIIYAAVAGQADVICTLDRHFSAPNVIEFCRMRNIRVMGDVELLALLARRRGR